MALGIDGARAAGQIDGVYAVFSEESAGAESGVFAAVYGRLVAGLAAR